MGRLKVNEIYLSIQGESSYAGWPCAFVRLTGCHLRCAYCDSEHAFYGGRWMSVDQIVARVRELGTPQKSRQADGWHGQAAFGLPVETLPKPGQTTRLLERATPGDGSRTNARPGAATPALGSSFSAASDVRTPPAAPCVPLVEITGGEPLLQPACGELAQRLMDAGYTVLCETSGALPIDRLPPGVIRIMDLKCPSSGECDANDWSNIARLTLTDEVKFVIGDRADYEWSREVMARYYLTPGCKVLMSPVFGAIEPVRIVEWILEDHLPVRFQLQMHKFIWAPDAIGV